MKTFPLLFAAGTLLLGSCAVQKTEAAGPSPARADAAAPPSSYEIGGPLAGVKINTDERTSYGAGYQFGSDLYPGSVEHSRYYWDKYMPVRPFFDRQSQLRNFLPRDLAPAGSPLLTQYAEPIYLNQNWNWTITDRKRTPVDVVRAKVKDPVFKLDFGDLPIGMYCVRVVGAVTFIPGRIWRLPLFITLKIDDGPSGEIHAYRQRCGYDGEFYSVSEIYFHAPEKRRYTAELFVDDGSQVELMVHNIILDDALAGAERRAIKTRMTLAGPTDQARAKQLVAAYRDPATRTNAPAWSHADRWRQDELIWESMPPLNRQPIRPLDEWSDKELSNIPGITIGAPDKTAGQIVKQYGAWTLKRHFAPLVRDPVLAENTTLKLTYSYDDLAAGKPFPDPYPYQDDGTGLVWPNPTDPAKGTVWAPMCELAWSACNVPDGSGRHWLETGDPNDARDAAMKLIRLAYDYPSLDAANAFSSLISRWGNSGRDSRISMRREREYSPGGWGSMMPDYDLLFEYLQDNQDLAASVHRFVPWVKTPRDIIKLIDTYYVQTIAKDFMRYQNVHIYGATELTDCAAVLADNRVTDPWMEWMFARFWIYPSRPDGIQNSMISGCDRCGAQTVGSIMYAGAGAMEKGGILDGYLAAGGNPKYDLSNPAVYPQPLAQCYWFINRNVAGQEGLRVGDVTGPEKPVGRFIDAKSFDGPAQAGWRWSGDARFAWILKNVVGRQKQSDAEWAKIEAAAAKIPRAPWLELHSRSVENWAAILESGLQHDDFRFRRAVYVRTGSGYGHEHEDALDLQVVAHGLPMTIDGGQRHGYSKPRDDQTRVHNTVEVDGQNNGHYAYAQTIADAEGARYMQVDGVPPTGANLFRRQVALIDVNEGQGSVPLSIAQQKLGGKLPTGVVTANSYVFDVFRVSGGKLQSYGFHGPVNGGVPTVPGSFESNLPDRHPVAALAATPADPDSAYLGAFGSVDITAPDQATPPRGTDSKFAGTAPDTLVATWKYLREGTGSERDLLQYSVFDPGAPPKFTRLYLLGVRGMHVLQGDSIETSASPVRYRWTQLMAQRRSDTNDLESAFSAIIEPYAGQPFLQSVKLLAIPGNDTDAQKAVAIEVTTTNGHTDVCFADGRPEKVRVVQGSGITVPEKAAGGRAFPRAADVRVAGEFAYYSTDAQGLRQATLAGGTLLEAAGITIKAARREYTGTVTASDYANKTLTIDVAWPAAATGRLFEVGGPGHRTSYSSTRLARHGKGTVVSVDAGADFFRSQVTGVETNPEAVKKAAEQAGIASGADAVGIVDCSAEPPPMTQNSPAGRMRSWVASNDPATKFWRADLLGGAKLLLRGPAVEEKDFTPSGALRLWEYGVGDTVRQSTFVSLRRVGPGWYEAQGDVDAEITIGGKTHQVSAADLAKHGGTVRLKIGD